VLAVLGERYHEHRRDLMRNLWLGLTDIYNLFHNRDLTPAIVAKVSGRPDVSEAGYQGILALRRLHRELDETIIAAYGWNGLDLGHDFHEIETFAENDRVRFTISINARKELLKRLLALNHKRAAEEKASAAAIITEKVARKPQKKAPVKLLAEPSLFDVGKFMMLSFPTTPKEKAFAAAALSIVEKAGAISSMDHLDIMLLATHPLWCKAFLSHTGRKHFEAAELVTPTAFFVGDQDPIMWKECRDYLEKRSALRIEHSSPAQTLQAGDNVMIVKASLSNKVDDIVAVALEAHKELLKLRQNINTASVEQKRVFNIFEKRHQEYQLAV